MNRPLLPALLALASLSACGETLTGVPTPPIDAPYFVYGGGSSGQALSNLSLRVVRASELPARINLPGSGNVQVDMFIAGLREEDMPVGLSPLDLEFVSEFEEVKYRDFVPLFDPHVLAYPAVPQEPNAFVPVFEAEGVTADDGQRRDRLDRLLMHLRIKDPCTDIRFRQTFRTERIPATQIFAAEALSNGDTVLALASSGTAALGLLPAQGGAVQLFGFELTPEVPLMRDERTEIYGLTRDEVALPDGRRLPRALALVRGGVLPHVAIWSDRARSYTDVTPRTFEPALGRLRAARILDLEGRPSLCVTGSVIEGSCGGFGLAEICTAGLWCMDLESETWTMPARIPRGTLLTGVVARPGLPLITVGVTGAVYVRAGTSGSEAWQPQFLPAVNVGCEPVCVSFTRFIEQPDPTRDLLGVAVGGEGQAFALRGTSLEDLRLVELPAVRARLFGDERRGDGFNLQAAAFSGDGALWLGGDRGVLVRVSPDLESAERICLPADLQDSKVSALAALENGDLIVAASPPRIAVARWQSP